MRPICLDDLYDFAREDVKKSSDLDHALADLVLRKARIPRSFTKTKMQLIRDVPPKEGGWYVFLSKDKCPIYVGTSFEGKDYSLYKRLSETLNDERWLFYSQYVRPDASLEDFSDIVRRHSTEEMSDKHIKKKYDHYLRARPKKS